MSQRGLWRRASLRALFYLLAGYGLGIFLGHRLVTTVALFGLLVFWIQQLYRLDQWLDDADEPPPEASESGGNYLVRFTIFKLETGKSRAYCLALWLSS